MFSEANHAKYLSICPKPFNEEISQQCYRLIGNKLRPGALVDVPAINVVLFQISLEKKARSRGKRGYQNLSGDQVGYMAGQTPWAH